MGLEITLEQIKEEIQKQSGSYQMDMIEKAYRLAQKAHEGQLRDSGDAYFSHPCSVALILIQLGMDTESVVAGLLHDVVEDTDVTLEDVKREFGETVASLVDAVTKIGKIPYSTKEEQQAENIRKMLFAMAEDIRVIIIKLADRLHNMRTLWARNEQKRRDTSRETLEIFAPIAHRLGIRGVKEELEDLAIRHLDPVAYAEIENALNTRKQYREEILQSIIQRIRVRLTPYIDNITLEGRVKSIHGIYRKMYMQGKAFEEIYDIYAVRVITDTVNDCYNILGLIHDMFRPIPGRFKDYISTPKPNMYQSLHTTVISREGIPFEVQIRTWEMHRTAEYGIAAHWKYKEGLSGKDKMEERLAWIRQLLETQQDSDDVEDIVRTIKTDLTQEDVFVVTPKGDVISLPVGSTVIDFAYAIHSAVGNRMIGAKVDGRITSLDHKVQTGEIVEILTTSQPGHGPSRDWLGMVKTSEARNKIRAWFKKEKRSENIETGRQEIEREFRRNNINLPEEKMNELLSLIAARHHCNFIEDLYAAVGYGGILLSHLMPRIKEEYQKIVKPAAPVRMEDIVNRPVVSKPTDGVVVEGIDNCLIKLSRCCGPVPGDPIIGFITRGHGVSIHKRDCTNVPRDLINCEEPERWVSAHWAAKPTDSFKCTILIVAIDRTSLLADVATALANMRLPIHGMNARELKDGNSQILVTISVESAEHMQTIMSKLKKIEGVIHVDRAGV